MPSQNDVDSSCRCYKMSVLGCGGNRDRGVTFGSWSLSYATTCTVVSRLLNTLTAACGLNTLSTEYTGA